MAGHLDVEQLKSMDYKNLQALAKDLGVSAGGKAEEIIARIATVEVEVPEGSHTTAEEKETADSAGGQQEEKEAVGGQVTEGAEDTEGEPQAGQETVKKDAVEETASGMGKAQNGEGKATDRITVKAATRFLDKQLNRIKEAGEIYQVSGERAKELAAAGVVEIVG